MQGEGPLSDEEIARRRKWYDIRDIFLGDNYRKRDLLKALELAETCDHKDAVWLTSLFSQHTLDDVKGNEDSLTQRVISILHTADDEDGRKWAYLGMISFNRDYFSIGAKKGHPLAMGIMSKYGRGNELVNRYVNIASSMNDPRALYYKARNLEKELKAGGHLQNSSVETPLQLLLRSARLGHVPACNHCIRRLAWTDVQWLHFADEALAVGGNTIAYMYIEAKAKEIEDEKAKNQNIDADLWFYRIGNLLNKHNWPEVLPLIRKLYTELIQVKLSLLFEGYVKKRDRAKAEVQTWSLAARRIGIIKDVRILIGKILWSLRYYSNVESKVT